MFPRRVQPLWTVEFDGAPSIARLGFLEGAARSVVSVAVPLDAFDAFRSTRAVSVTYAVGAVVAMTVTLSAANLEHIVLRRWVTTLGLVLTITAATILSVARGPAFAIGIAAAAAGASLFSNTLSLYIMEHITKSDLARSESTRLIWAGTAWLLGPFVGVLLRQSMGSTAPYVVSATLAVAALLYFWLLRLGSHPVLRAPSGSPPNPLRSIPRYFNQRYLRIAYAVTLVRATVWVTVFVYGSAYVVETGLPTWASGAFLSSVATLLFAAPVVAGLAQRRGTRTVVALAFSLIAAGLTFVAILPEARPVGLVGWTVAALGASALDVVGNIPFMRTVKRRERVAMTGVFSTWRDTSTILSPTLAAVILTMAPVRVFYAVLAVVAAVTATTARLLPRRL